MFDTDEAPVGAPRWPQPGEVWSLWDMLRAYAHEFCQVDRALTEYLMDFPPTQLQANAFEEANGKPWPHATALALKSMEPLIEKLPVGPGVRKQFQRSIKEAAGGQYQSGFEAVKNLRSRLRDELEDLQFLHVTPRLAEGLGDKPAFGEAVEQAFPNSGLEIKDAAHCLALGQGTATVFHCMRALEPALISLGRRFGVEVQENWNAALNLIEAAIRNRDNKTKFPNWKEDEPFYMDACTHFFIIKNAWRNHTMHLRLRFAESDALSVFEHTRAFMQQLATRLSEDVEGASPEQASP